MRQGDIFWDGIPTNDNKGVHHQTSQLKLISNDRQRNEEPVPLKARLRLLVNKRLLGDFLYDHKKAVLIVFLYEPTILKADRLRNVCRVALKRL